MLLYSILIILATFSNSLPHFLQLEKEPLLLSSETTSYTNPLNKIRKSVVNTALVTLPKKSTISQIKMNLAMKSAKTLYSFNDAECAYFIYKWIAENIAYDCYGMNHGQKDQGEIATYNNGKGLYSGISLLFKEMCKNLGLDAESIIGYGKPDVYYDELSFSSNHAWNVVKIEKSYYLVDVIWGAGSCSKDNKDIYVKSFNDYYFCPRPEAFIRRHLPEENKWQLLPNIITSEQFRDMAYLEEQFFTNGFLSISPDNNNIDINGKAKVELSYEEMKHNFTITIGLYHYDNNKLNEIKGSILFYDEKGKIKIDISANNITTYTLLIFISHDLKNYFSIAQMNINNKKILANPIFYPIQYNQGTHTDLIEPLNSKLTKGTLVDFKLKTNTYDNIIIRIGEYFERVFEKLDNGIFYGESFYIFGDKIKVTTFDPKKGYYYYLFVYETVNNPNMDEEPTFPETSIELPPNVLYSPLIDVLKKGNTYNFKIKCKSVQEMYVFDGDNFFDLTKSDNIFSGQIKISNDASQILIVGNPFDSTDELIFYNYKTK